MSPQSHAQQFLNFQYLAVLRKLNAPVRRILALSHGPMEELPRRVMFDSTPILNGAESFAAIDEDANNNTGTLVVNLIAGHVSGLDPSDQPGIAITAVDSSHGQLQYTLDGGSNWITIASASKFNALVLAGDSATRVRLVPDANWFGSISDAIQLRAWSGNSENPGDRVDVVGDNDFSSASALSPITVNPINDAPVNTAPGAQSTLEDNALVFSAVNGNAFAVFDVDAASAQMQVTLSVTTGTLTLFSMANLTFITGDGVGDTTMTFTGSQAHINHALNSLTYVPAANASGIETLTFTTNDQGNSGGGSALSDTNAVQITVTNANDAPVNSLPPSQTVSGGGILNLGSGSGAAFSITDVDAAVSALQVSLSASAGSLTLASTTGLIFTTGDGTYDSSMVFQGNLAAINTALDGMTYNAPLILLGTATIDITTSDLGNTGAGGALTDSDTLTVGASVTNQAPVNTIPAAQNINEDENLVFSTSSGNSISIADPDAGSGAMKVSLQSTNGKMTLSRTVGLTFNTGDGNADANMSFTGTLADINNALDGLVFTPNPDFSGAPTISLTTNDQGNSGSGGPKTDSSTININVSAVNDAPVNTVPATQTTLEDTAIVLSAASGNAVQISDVDAGSAIMQITLTMAGGTLTLSTASGLTFTSGDGTNDSFIRVDGTIASINAALNGMIFTPAADVVGPTSIQIGTSDQGNTGAGGALTTFNFFLVNVTAVNDAPVVSAPGAQSGFEDAPFTFSTTNSNAILVTDVDATNIAIEKVTLTATHGTLTLASFAGLSFTTGDGTTDSAMVFTGSLDDINAALDGLTFTPAVDYIGAATVQLLVDDQGYSGIGGAKSAATSVTVNLSPTNDAPTISVPGSQATDEDTALTFWNLFGNAITVADIDAASGPLSVTLSASSGAFTLSTTTGLSFITGDGTNDPTVIFTGALVAINAALDGMTYTPAADFNGADTITIAVNDQGNTGAGGPLTASANITVIVAPVNDAPTVTDAGNQITDEDTDIVFTGSNKITIADVDAGSGTLTVTLSSAKAHLNLSQTTGLTFTSGDGHMDKTMSFSGTLANINAALDGMFLRPVDGFEGATSLQIFVQDNGNTGAGGPATAVRNMSVQVTGVNSPPQNQLPSSAGAQEDVPLILSGASKIVITDPDAGSATVRVSLWATHGRLTLSGTTGLNFITGDGTDDATLIVEGSLASINAALNGMTFDPDANYHGAGQIRVLTDDLGNSGAGSPQSDDDTLAITISAIDDAPTSIGLADITVDEDSAQAAVDLTTRFSDIDDSSSSLDYTITANTNSALFSSAVIDPVTHELKLAYAKDANGVAHLIIRATDSSGLSVDVPLTVTVDAVNDAPIVATNTGTSVTGSAAVTVAKQALRVNDVDNAAHEITYKLTKVPTGGTLTLSSAFLKIGSTFTQSDIDAGKLEYHTDGAGGSDNFEFIASDKSGATTANTRFAITRTAGGSLSLPLPPPVVSPPPPAKVPTPDPSTDDPKTDRDHKNGGYVMPLPTFGHTSARPPSSKGTGGGTGDEPTAAPADVESQSSAPAPELKADAPIASSNAPAPAPDAPPEVAPPAPAPAPTAPTVASNSGQSSNAVASAPRIASIPTPRPAPAPGPPSITPAQSAQQVQFVTEASKLWTELDQFHKQMTEQTSTLHLVAGTASFVTFGMSIVYILWTIRAGYLVASLLSTMPAWRVIDPLPILDHFEDETERRRRRALEDGESLESLVDRPMVERAGSLIGEAS
jgi:hypothetical protein